MVNKEEHNRLIAIRIWEILLIIAALIGCIILFDKLADIGKMLK
jgi:hypothetical protein